MKREHPHQLVIVLLFVSFVGILVSGPLFAAEPSAEVQAILENLDSKSGIGVILDQGNTGPAIELARASRLIIYLQLPDARAVERARREVEEVGLLNSRIYVGHANGRIPLADNLADFIVATEQSRSAVPREEIMRVLRPRGVAILGPTTIRKPVPEGVDSWSHPYHGPDNNTQSTDQLARAPYLTQFIADPKFCPMPEVSVAAGGRVYRAFGHIAHRSNQNAMLNTLLCYNAYNGTILWRRPLPEGFMIHRSTMIATPDALYMGDDQSCKVIDAVTGKVIDEIVVPADVTSDGPVWKWMALEDGVLYALVGGTEIKPATQKSADIRMGHWPWGMWEGHAYEDPKTSFGFGRTMLAIDLKTKKTLWDHQQSEYIDSRGVCMSGGRIYIYSPEKYLVCLDAKTGETVWKNADRELLEAIGRNGRAQNYVNGYATSAYMKCSEKYLFFAGPQRPRLVVAQAADGKLLWQRANGNCQIVLRDNAIYCAGQQKTPGFKLAYETGEVLAELPTRRACTRATGSIDSIFYRTSGGTIRLDTATDTARHIAPMRPPCQDGVIISDGYLYWGPWMCGCQLSLYGHIALGPAGRFFEQQPATDQLWLGPDDPTSVEPLVIETGDWPTYGGNNKRSCATATAIPREVELQWTYKTRADAMPTAPILAGGLTFFGDRAGTITALDSKGVSRWRFHTGGAIYYPPVVSEGRLFAGSADGRVYALEATTGRLLWSYRVAPFDRRISVFDHLISTWPVAGGVVVERGIVYAAAGLTHYDGTHVVALDPATGVPRWKNDTSGVLSEQVDNGISMQGDLYISGGELRFEGGGVYQIARYDLETGRCLNQPVHGLISTFRTAFYPYYPTYGRYASLNYAYGDGRSLVHRASYEGSAFSDLALYDPTAPRRPGSPQATSRKPVWRIGDGIRYTSFVVGPNLLLATGDQGRNDRAPFLAALDIEDGSDVWRKELPTRTVKGGTAVDSQGRIVVTLEDGTVLCFAGGKTP